MSKTTTENKKTKLKGKQAKIAKAIEKKETSDTKKSKKTTANKNIGKCCTCTHYPKHIKGIAQPCKILNKYVARKAEHSECYKCKFN